MDPLHYYLIYLFWDDIQSFKVSVKCLRRQVPLSIAKDPVSEVLVWRRAFWRLRCCCLRLFRDKLCHRLQLDLEVGLCLCKGARSLLLRRERWLGFRISIDKGLESLPNGINSKRMMFMACS